jgi:hypothetical protein
VFGTAFPERLWDTSEPLFKLLRHAQLRSLPYGNKDEAVLPAALAGSVCAIFPNAGVPNAFSRPLWLSGKVMLNLSPTPHPTSKRQTYDLTAASGRSCTRESSQGFSIFPVHRSCPFHAIETLTGLGILSPSDN